MATYQALFEFLSDCGLGSAKNLHLINKWNKDFLLEFGDTAAHLVSSEEVYGNAQHGFVANSSLGAGPWPCIDVRCRIQQADRLAQFAALYADVVLIQDRFGTYTEDNTEDLIRNQLTGDVAVIHHLRPLLESGIIGIAPSYHYLCQHHMEEFRDRNQSLAGSLDGALATVARHFADHVTIRVARTGFAELSGPPELIPHGTCFFGPVDQPGTERSVSADEWRAIFDSMISRPSLEDIVAHDLYAQTYGYSYLTDRDLDLSLIKSLNEPEIQAVSDLLSRELTHMVPVLNGLDVATLSKVREKEGEAFAVYRDALKKLLNETDLTSRAELRLALRDGVLPEINKINMAARNARESAMSTLSREVVIGGGAVTIGLLLGTTAGSVLAALGGLDAAKTILAMVLDATDPEPRIVRDSAFFFLWKAAQFA